MTPPAEPPNGRDRLDASVAGQKIGLTTNNLIAVLFIGLIGVLLWMFWGSGQVIMQRDITDRHRIAQEQQEEHAGLRQEIQALKQAMEGYHLDAVKRSMEETMALARWILIHDHNQSLEPGQRTPFGTFPEWMDEWLKSPHHK